MPNILVVSRFFPPLGSPGFSIRITKFLKYGANGSWKYTIMTEDPDKPVISQEEKSHFFLKEIPSDVKIVRIPNPVFSLLKKFLFLKNIFGSTSLFWTVNMVVESIKLNRNMKYDLVFANVPNFSNAIGGLIVAKLINKPFVLDIKDDFVGSPGFHKKGQLRKILDNFAESIVINNSCAVITVSQHSLANYQSRYKYLNLNNNLHLISNGVDLEEFCVENSNQRVKNEKFVILSALSKYSPDSRDLTSFIKGLKFFVDRSKRSIENISVVFVGSKVSKEYQEEFKKNGFSDKINYLPTLPREEYIEWLNKADLFFAVQDKENRSAIPGTLYEYWAVGNAPILLISEKGSASQLVEDNSIGSAFLYDDIPGIASFIEQCYSNYISNINYSVSRVGLSKYSRKKLTKKLLNVFEKCLDD